MTIAKTRTLRVQPRFGVGAADVGVTAPALPRKSTS